MDNSLLAVRDINHKYIVVEKGISISNYIIQKRVEEAKKLLTQSTLPINTVSLYVGYSNFSYFTKMFKDNTGYAPLEYRRSFSEK